MIIATLETANFSFEAFGDDVDEAIAAMRLGWELHAEQTRASISWDELRLDMDVRTVTAGSVWRDRSRLPVDAHWCADAESWDCARCADTETV